MALEPSFQGSILTYEADTINATNKITAVAEDPTAEIAILVNGEPHVNATSATWLLGANTVEITVTKGTESREYVVIVTKS